MSETAIEPDDTTPVRDQRTMIDVGGGQRPWETVAEVEQAWQTWADREGLPWRRRTSDYTTDLHESRKTVSPYISAGKWLATCPACNGGIACWNANPRGCCLDCGTIYKVQFPDKATVRAAVKILVKRPNPVDWNWMGEPAEQLQAWNDANPDIARYGKGVAVLPIADLERDLDADTLAKLRDKGFLPAEDAAA